MNTTKKCRACLRDYDYTRTVVLLKPPVPEAPEKYCYMDVCEACFDLSHGRGVKMVEVPPNDLAEIKASLGKK